MHCGSNLNLAAYFLQPALIIKWISVNCADTFYTAQSSAGTVNLCIVHMTPGMGLIMWVVVCFGMVIFILDYSCYK